MAKTKRLKFTADVAEFVKESDERMNAVVLDSTQTTINIANNPRAKGGLMRVDTGFLRASGQIGLDAMPTGPGRGVGRKNKSDKSLIYEAPESYAAKLSGFNLGQTIFFIWSASYAEVRNAYDGFLDNAVQQWPETVRGSVEKLRRRLGK